MGVKRLMRRHLGVIRRVDGSLGRAYWLTHVGLPVVTFALVLWLDPAVTDNTLTALLTTAGLFAAFSFGLAIQLLARAASLEDEGKGRSAKLDRATKVTERVAGSAAYLSLVAIGVSASALLATMTSAGWPDRLTAAFTLGAASHLAASVCTITIRIFTLTAAHLSTARSEHSSDRVA